MAIIRSGAGPDSLMIDALSKAMRVTPYDSSGRELTRQLKNVFSASDTFTPNTLATDMVTISGSSSRTIRVLSFVITTTNTAAGSQAFILIKRSTADTNGNFVAAIAVPHDSSGNPATAVVGSYQSSATGNPTLGTATGNVNIVRVASPVLVGASWAGITFNAGVEMIPMVDPTARLITLRGAAQQLCLSFNGVALVAGQIHAYRIVWMEE